MIPDIELAGDDSDLDEEIKDIIQDWLEGKIDLQNVLNESIILGSEEFREELKSDSNTDGVNDSNNNPNRNEREENAPKSITSGDNAGKQKPTADGPPDDIRAFYGHPLTAATASVNDADTHASAVALLHEYINLPALDRSGMKIGDKINSIYDIMRDDGSSAKSDRGNEAEGDYLQMLQTTLASEVDKFFNRSCGVDSSPSIISGDNCGVSIAEEVINEVCVETTCLNTGTVDPSELYTSVPDSEASNQDGYIDSDNSLLSMTMPSLEDFRNETPAQGCSASRVSAAVPPIAERSTGRRSRESKEQGTAKQQELSKKLVKALTDKIMKRMNEKEQQQQPKSKTEVETAVSNLTKTSLCAPANCADSYSQENRESGFMNVTSNQRHKTIVNLTENVPVIETSNFDASPVTLASYSSPIQLLSSFQTVLPPASLGLNSDIGCQNLSVQTHLMNVSLPEQIAAYHTPDRLQSVNHSFLQTTPINEGKHSRYVRNNSVPFANQNNCQTNSNSLGSFSDIKDTPSMYYYTNASHVPNMYTPPLHPPPPPSAESDCDILLQRYIHQQNSYVPEQLAPRGDILKSPDSGYAEPCVSPREQSNVQYSDSGTDTETEKRGGKVAKRRKSAPPMYVKQYWNPLEKYSKSTITKLEVDPAGYKYCLECPISTTQRIEEDRITYLNKGQYYALTLEHDGKRTIKSSSVKSVIMVIFREDKHLDDERKAWEFWHSRQHSYKQRVIDIDTKNSVNVNPNCTEEISYNAVAVKWDPRNSPAKVNIAVHCLSTDFSNQKGVKGLPLHIQIDTYENSTKDIFPISRGYCQIKVFCDKGAERKIRDEERRKQCRANKTENQPATKAIRKRHEEVYHESLGKSEFYPMADLQTQPILFTPTFECDDSARPSPLNISVNDEDGSSSISSSVDHYDSAEDGSLPIKRPRTDSYVHYQNFSNILLYVREKQEVVFTAVMLRSPTLHGLLQAVEEKYKVPVAKIMNVFKRSKKGILVRMDDNIIRHYSHESTFIIELNKRDDNEYELVLTEIDT